MSDCRKCPHPEHVAECPERVTRDNADVECGCFTSPQYIADDARRAVERRRADPRRPGRLNRTPPPQ